MCNLKKNPNDNQQYVIDVKYVREANVPVA